VELYQLECFRVLCKYGNFTSAAEELMVTQPAVSVAVKKLEDEFGEDFIDRSSKVFALTHVGETVLKYAVNIHNEVKNLRRELHVDSRKRREIIRIAIPITMCPKLLPVLMADFAIAHKDVTLNILQKGHNAIAETLASGNADLGIVSRDFLGPLLAYRNYTRVEFFVSYNPAHRFASLKRITAQDLKGEKLFFSNMPNSVPDYILNWLAKTHILPDIIYHDGFPDDSVECARRSGGIALCAGSVAGETYAPLSPPLFCDLVIAWKKSEPLTQEKTNLVEFIAESAGTDTGGTTP